MNKQREAVNEAGIMTCLNTGVSLCLARAVRSLKDHLSLRPVHTGMMSKENSS